MISTYCFSKFQKFSIKRTVRSQSQEIVLFDFITVIYFLLKVLFQDMEGLKPLTYRTYNRELRVGISEQNFPKTAIVIGWGYFAFKVT